MEPNQNSAKQIVFRYNGDPASDEVEVDLNGEASIPEKGWVIKRKDKSWSVVQVNVETSLSAEGPTPVVLVFLTDQL